MDKIQIGDKVRIVNNIYCHGFPIGSIQTIDDVDYVSYNRVCYIINGFFLTSEEIVIHKTDMISKNIIKFSFI